MIVEGTDQGQRNQINRLLYACRTLVGEIEEITAVWPETPAEERIAWCLAWSRMVHDQLPSLHRHELAGTLSPQQQRLYEELRTFLAANMTHVQKLCGFTNDVFIASHESPSASQGTLLGRLNSKGRKWQGRLFAWFKRIIVP